MHSASGKFAILVLIGCVKEVFRVHFHCKLVAVVLFFWSLSKIYCLVFSPSTETIIGISVVEW